MLINIDYRKKEAIYEQIVLEIERYVSLDILKEKEKMPSVRTLAETLGINPNTVKKAYDILEEKGVIETLSTKGTFVRENTKLVKDKKKKEIITTIKKHMKELENLGMEKSEIIKEIEK